MALADSIHDWLISDREQLRSTCKWIWGTEAFWFAFTTAYPAFPHGEWPNWDPEIDMEGRHISKWLKRLNADEEAVAEDSEEEMDLGVTWQVFQSLILNIQA